MRWSACLVALLLIPLASAQGVYLTDELVATTNAGTTSYVASEGIPADSKAYAATGFGALAYTTAFEHKVGAGFTPEGTVSATAFISCDSQTVFRPGAAGQLSTARMEFVKDGTVLATVNLESLRTCDGPADIWEAVFATDALAGTTFGTGSTFTMNLILWVPTGNPGSGVENVYVLVGPSFPSGASGPGLPGGDLPAPAGPVVVHANITDGFEHSWATPRNGTFLLNATVEGPVQMTLNATTSQGQAAMQIVDGNGTQLFQGPAENATVDLDGAPGTWRINVTYDGYVGDLAVRLVAPEQPARTDPAPGDAPHATGNETMEGEGNETAPPAVDEESPGLGALVVVGLLAAAFRRRRSG